MNSKLYVYGKEATREPSPDDVFFGSRLYRILGELKERGRQREDGRWDFSEGVDLSYVNLSFLPLKFGIVKGDFNCSANKLTTLEGAPKVVEGGFYCFYNRLTTLEGAPEVVEGDFICHSNKISEIELRKTVKRDYLV